MVMFKSLHSLFRNQNVILNGLKNRRFVSNTSLPLVATKNQEEFDSLVLIGSDLEADLAKYNLLDQFNELKTIKEMNTSFEKELTFTLINKKRVIYSPTGPLNRDYDDVRKIADATKAAIKKCVKVGSKKPLLINCAKHTFEEAEKVALLAALDAAHVPIEMREFKNKPELLSIESLGHYFDGANAESGSKLLKLISAIELGRVVTRDIGGGDPERMTPQRIHEYVNEAFKSSDSVKITSIEGQDVFEKEYPLFAAVNRAANVVPRHRGRIVKLVYEPEGAVDTTLFLVGKGMTYDTGGADLKINRAMTGMCRDKCGAAFVAGFFKTLSLLKPKGLKVVGTLCLTRNNIGEECYVSDEIITARSKKRVLVNNTDAEGRFAMADLLCEAKEQAKNEVNPHLFTIATLTGHAIVCYGQNYSAVMSNGPALSKSVDKNLSTAGTKIGDPYEISILRGDDYKKHTSTIPNQDLLQIGAGGDTLSFRSHQGAAAFLIMASGLDQHGLDSKEPLSYTHLDIAGSSGYKTENPTGAPLPSFVYNYLLPRI